MSIELNQFTQGVDNHQLNLSDGPTGEPIIVTAKLGFIEKILQFFSNIPLLSDMEAVKDFVRNQTDENLKVLGVFIHALSNEYGEDIADQITEKMDLSGRSPLNERLVRQIIQGSIEGDIQSEESSEKNVNPNKLSDKAQAERTLIGCGVSSAYCLDNLGKQLSELNKPNTLPSPKSLSYVSSFFYSETDSMQKLQKEVAEYNQIIKDFVMNDEAQTLAKLFDNPVSEVVVTEQLKTFSNKVEKLQGALARVESAYQSLTELDSSDAKQLGAMLSQEHDLLDKNHILVEEFQGNWNSNINDYKNFHEFFSSCSSRLQSTMTPELKRLCFELITESPHFETEGLANHLPNMLAQYDSDMSAVNLRVLSDILAEKIPTLADDVQIAFPKPEQKAQFGAIQLITQALIESQKQLSAEQRGIDERLDLSGKMADLQRVSVKFETFFQELMNSDSNQEDQFVATLWAITGQEWLVAKNDTLIPDDLTDYEDLNLSSLIKKELQEGHVSDDIRQIARNVVQAQYRVSWLDQRNTITFESNNNAGVDIYSDVEAHQLVDNLTQNLPRYSDYIEEKASALASYIAALEAFSQHTASIGSEVTNQVSSIIVETKIQFEHLNKLRTHCNSVQQVVDTKVLLSNKLARVETMLDHSTTSITQRLNLQGFLTFLPSLRANNDKVRELVIERNNLQNELENKENHTLKERITSLNTDIQILDDEYERRLLELTRLDRQINQDKGYPGENGNSIEAWSAWVKQNVSGSLSGDFRPDMSALLLERQMTKAGISSYTEAYKTVFVPLVSGQVTISYDGVKKALVDLHHWAMSHPLESQALAGDLNHVFQIVSTNGGFFGSDVAAMASTIWSTGTVESQVKDILQGRREFLPSQESLSMTPEMIALLHLAKSAPYMASAIKGLAGGGLMANGAGLLVSTLMPGGAFVQPMARMLGGIVQTWSESRAANIVTQHRTTEIMVNALMRGLINSGSFKDRAQAMAFYTMQRQALQDVGTISRDCFETDKMSTIRRAFQDVKNTWSEMDWKAKTFTLATTSAISVGAAAITALGVISIIGTGGISIAIAVLAGVGAMSIGGFFARTMINLVAASNFLGMNDANERAREKMTQQRIDQALERIEARTNNKRLAELLSEELEGAGKSLKLNDMSVKQQEQALQDEITQAASQSVAKLDSQYRQARTEDIAVARTLTVENYDEKVWEGCHEKISKYIKGNLDDALAFAVKFC
ncbi:type III secretion system effector BopA family protein [Vibrio hepatarius]|uniref:type III secretion system effector BopA family protein n=1 Tax=Vibrio hepatarius TaxID=171383 RepID=UPI001C08BC2A|nr:type III secretion system effector BopA family protein [Vibrio hepatarius]MBU2898907.1 hypothetical protein [Vibrio hepatarius]